MEAGTPAGHVTLPAPRRQDTTPPPDHVSLIDPASTAEGDKIMHTIKSGEIFSHLSDRKPGLLPAG